MGEGERPYRLLLLKEDGEPGALELKDDLREDASMGGGGNMNAGVLPTEVAGVKGPASFPYPETELWASSFISSAKTEADSASLVVDSLRYIRGRTPP